MSDRLKAYDRERKARIRLANLTCPAPITPASEARRRDVIDAIYEFGAASRAAGAAFAVWKLQRSSRRR